jgi:hypothetical protein
MKIIEAVVVILIVALGVSFVLNYSLYASNQQLRSEFNSLNETLAFPQSVSVTDAPLGLNLSIAVNTTLLQSGQGIEITINETNTLDALNTVSATTGWQSTPQLSLGPCGVGDYPMGLAICQGYYTPSSISSAEPLYIYAPGTFACPMLIRLITSYTFQPLSNMASISPPSNSFFMPMNSSFAANGYWTGNLKGQTEFSNFSPGIYTVVGGDEWGQLVLLHFVVI